MIAGLGEEGERGRLGFDELAKGEDEQAIATAYTDEGFLLDITGATLQGVGQRKIS